MSLTDVDDLPCNRLVELGTDYLDNKLDEERRRRFEAHLDVCEGCRNYLEQMRTTIALTGTLTEEDIHGPARERLLAAFRDWKRTG
jgi:anti-sigma factor RsiW